MRDIFESEYVSQYGLKLEAMPIELVSWHVTARGDTPSRSANAAAPSGTDLHNRTRTVFFKGKPTQVPVRHRTELRYGEVIEGPVIVEERETTSFILPGWTLELHETGSLIANKKKGA
jgi:N-methylhydantoinase A